MQVEVTLDVYLLWRRKGKGTLSVPISAPPKFVKVVVYDRQSDRVGSKTVTLK